MDSVEVLIEPKVLNNLSGKDARLRSDDSECVSGGAKGSKCLLDTWIDVVFKHPNSAKPLSVQLDSGVDELRSHQGAEREMKRRPYALEQGVVRRNRSSEVAESVLDARDDSFTGVGEGAIQVKDEKFDSVLGDRAKYADHLVTSIPSRYRP